MLTDRLRECIQKEFENLKNSSSLLRPLIESGGYGLALISSDFHVIEANSRMLEWFPKTHVSTFPLCHNSFYFQTDVLCENCPAVKSLKDGKKHSTIIEQKVDNKSISFKVSCTPITGNDGTVWGMLELVEDVSEKIRQEKELSYLEARYQQMIENASDAIISFDVDGKIFQFNRKSQDLFGFSLEEAKKMTIFSLMPEELHAQQKKLVQEIFLTGDDLQTSRVFEGVCLTREGTSVTIEATFSRQITAGKQAITAILRDISERKIYEEKLKSYTGELEREVESRTKQLLQSERRYRTLLGTANDAIISTDKNGKILYLNRKAQELFEYHKTEVLEKNLLKLAPEEVWDTALQELQKADFSARGKIFESYGIKKAGETFPAEITVSLFEWDGEHHLTFIARDITLRKSLETEIKEYTAKLEEKVRERTYELTASQQSLKEKVSELSILNEISEVLASTTDVNVVLNVILAGATSHQGLGFNRAFLFLLDNDRSFLEGRVAIGPADAGEAQKIWGEILGKNLSLRETLQSYTDIDEKTDTHVNNIAKSIRISLADENNILIKAVKSGESFNVKDAAGSPDVPEELLNKLNCNEFAITPLIAEGVVLGVLWADNAITKSPIEHHDIEKLRAFAINASLAIEKSELYKVNVEKVLELDIAYRELKKNRDRLIRAEKLAAVGEMSATVAHGIRNPLVAIGGFARRLFKNESRESTNKKYLRIIVEEIDRLEMILSELLSFIRPQKLSLEKISLNEVIDKSLQVFDFEFKKRNVAIEKEFSPVPTLEIDCGQFKRVLQNMFNNAMDAMPEGGRLKIVTGMEDSLIKLSVSDTGIGIPEEDLENVFHPFFTSKATGTGLGLPICNQIISIHNGHISLGKNEEDGMTFNIYLPPVKKDDTV